MKSIIDAPCGRLLGTQDNGVTLFRNIPYASAPIGDLRFAPPQAMAAWSGTRDAALAGFVPPQGKSRLAAITGGDVEMQQSEDCLTLELTRGVGTGSSRPVLVWIHGGGFVGGSGSHPWYSAAALARRGDVVVVNLNFRQGVLGHLCLPGVSPGNLALLDIVMALRWVRLNIAAFGGDPDCVTVFGQSSGASAIAALLAMPAAEGLFHRAILQSPPLGRGFRTLEQASRLGTRFTDLLGGGFEQTAALRSVPCSRVLAAQGEFIRSFKAPVLGASEQAFGPIIDGTTLTAATDAWSLKPGRSVDILIGTNQDEQSSGLVLDERFRNATIEQAKEVFTYFSSEHAADLLELYSSRHPHKSPAHWLADFYTDMFYRLAVGAYADLHTRKGSRTWLYQFDWQSPGGYGACHCLELPFVFGNLRCFADAPMLKGVNTDVFDSLSGSMQDAWINFARTGNPQGIGATAWPRYEPGARLTMCLNTDSEVIADAGRYATHPLRV